MAKGSSGRLVIEIDPELKEELYEALGDEGLKMKEWFLQNASMYLNNRKQPSLPFSNQSDSKRGTNDEV